MKIAKNTTKQKLRHTGAVTIFVMFLTAPGAPDSPYIFV